MKRRDALKYLAAAAAAAGLPATALAMSGGWRLLGQALPYLPELPQFGTSNADTSVSNAGFGVTRTVYVDPSRGSSGDGSSLATALTDLPALLAADTKYLVRAGTTLVCDWNAIHIKCLLENVSNVVVSVCDSAGREITSQANPFQRAISRTGGWVSGTEASTQYFRMAGSGPSFIPSSGRYGIFFVAQGTCRNVVLRGAWLDGAAHSVLNLRGAAKVRLEDCIVTNTGFTPGPNTPFGSGYGGNVVRWMNDTATPVAGQELVRCYIGGTGDDALHIDNGSYAFRITDCAIRAHANFTRYGSQHADGIQMMQFPGAFLLQRNVIEHIVPEFPMLDDGAGGGLLPIGSCVTDSGESGTSGQASGGQVVDCVMLSNSNVFNYNHARPLHKRVLAYMHRRPKVLAGDYPILAFAGQAQNITEQGCVTVFDNTLPGDGAYSSSAAYRPIGNAGTVVHVRAAA